MGETHKTLLYYRIISSRAVFFEACFPPRAAQVGPKRGVETQPEGCLMVPRKEESVYDEISHGEPTLAPQGIRNFYGLSGKIRDGYTVAKNTLR